MHSGAWPGKGKCRDCSNQLMLGKELADSGWCGDVLQRPDLSNASKDSGNNGPRVVGLEWALYCNFFTKHLHPWLQHKRTKYFHQVLSTPNEWSGKSLGWAALVEQNSVRSQGRTVTVRKGSEKLAEEDGLQSFYQNDLKPSWVV